MPLNSLLRQTSVCLVLLLASLTGVAAKSLLLDFGPTVVAASNATLSAAHAVGMVPATEIAWNTLQADTSALVFSDGSAATGVAANLGRSLAGGSVIDFNDHGFLSAALAGQIKGGIYVGSSPLRDACYGGSGGANALALGVRLNGLAAGTYTVYFSSRNTSTATATPQRFYCASGPSADTFAFAAAALNADLLNSAPPVTNAFVRGDNYDYLVVTLAAGEALYLAAVGLNDGVNQELRGFINAVAIVFGLPPAVVVTPPLIGSPVVTVTQNHLTLTYRRAKAATNYAFTVGRSSNLVDWVSGTNVLSEAVLADDGTNETRMAQDKLPVTAQPASFMRLRVNRQIQNAKVVAFGDSITFGYGVPTASNWVNRLTARFNLKLVNAGVTGNTSSQGLARMQAAVLNHNPDFVIINFGMNDHVMTALDVPKVNPATFRTNLMTMIDRVRTNNAIPILVTVNGFIAGDATQYYYNRHPVAFYANVGGAPAWLDSYIQIVRDVAAAKLVELVDVRAAYDQYSPYEFLRSLTNAANNDDGVHPYLLGSSVYAQLIGDYLAAHY